jgi:hypothetical protein
MALFDATRWEENDSENNADSSPVSRFLAGANREDGNPELLMQSVSRMFGSFPGGSETEFPENVDLTTT